MSVLLSPVVLVASDEVALLDEIVRYLEEIPHWTVVSTRSASELITLVEQQAPDSVLVSDGLARDLAVGGPSDWSRARLIVLGRQDHPDTLRAALRLGARGFVLWPAERGELRGLVESGLTGPRARRGAAGSLEVVWGPKGGSGTSVLAAHLAGALAVLGVDCALVDLDLDHGDQSAILGAEGETRTVLDLLRVVDEISPAVLDSVAWRHPAGLRAILSPASPGEASLVKASDLARALGSLREVIDHVVVDLPSGFGEAAIACSEAADRILLVVTPDLLSLRRGREAMAAFRSAGIDPGRVGVILNRSSAAADISLRDVEAVLGRPVFLSVRDDASLRKAPNRGELSETGLRLLGRAARRIAGVPEARPSGLARLLRR